MSSKRIISIFPVILTMTAIFMFSSQTADESSNVSTGVSQKIQQILLFLREYEVFENLEYIVRKSAHFIIYMILGFFMSVHMNFYDFADKIKCMISAAVCFLYASSDEIHQLFVDGRSGQFSDVLLDTSGSITGIFIFYLIFRILIRRKQKARDIM